ncbi:thioesterase family protein [Mycobacterium sp. NAZ190054]|uniref:acyl-CoA thioesterase n=1 Tax=Mycobacterium sp. NAZ190054 TaxID=1747766 RepID=UPI0021009FBF|nr:thioesterase family protein [Mycobacterium sp. NAZ190054]
MPLRWRDLDHQGHVYHATLLTLLDEARTQWISKTLGSETPDSYVLARIELDYRAELRKDDDAVAVTFGVQRVGNTSLTLTEVVRSWATGSLIADATTTIVLWDRAARSSRPLTADERRRAAESAGL